MLVSAGAIVLTNGFLDAEASRKRPLTNFLGGLARGSPAHPRKSFAPLAGAGADIAASRYNFGRLKTFVHLAVGRLPPAWREAAAERWLRRKGSPAPAAEHVVQYLLSLEKAKTKSDGRSSAVVAKGADLFYERQYRQCFNATMGAFAMTAAAAALGAGSPAEGRLWSRRRKTCAAMLNREGAGGSPIIVIEAETVAIPMLLPAPHDAQEGVAVARWLAGGEAMPPRYRDLARGAEVSCFEEGARALERTAQGALLEVVDAVAQSRRLAVLALNPCDPDAMGLHVTLFDARFLTAKLLERDHGLPRQALAPSRAAAQALGALLIFCVGATEEVFTQCSQNLFVKRPLPQAEARRRAARPPSWRPHQPLERLIERQFELLQFTVSASGLPGVSPRNGDRGKTAFVEQREGRTFVLIPYHPGNSVHGHAAKLWSNPYGSLLVHDDTETGTAVTISGACSILSHQETLRAFPQSAETVATIKNRKGSPMPDPEYWFAQGVEEIETGRDALLLYGLDPARPTCSISAAGPALFDKKPAYFAAGSLPAYDMQRQHRREAMGRRRDPSGAEHDRWNETVRQALLARLAHLETVWRAA